MTRVRRWLVPAGAGGFGAISGVTFVLLTLLASIPPTSALPPQVPYVFAALHPVNVASGAPNGPGGCAAPRPPGVVEHCVIFSLAYEAGLAMVRTADSGGATWLMLSFNLSRPLGTPVAFLNITILNGAGQLIAQYASGSWMGEPGSPWPAPMGEFDTGVLNIGNQDCPGCTFESRAASGGESITTLS